jgi:hypothetical protein
VIDTETRRAQARRLLHDDTLKPADRLARRPVWTANERLPHGRTTPPAAGHGTRQIHGHRRRISPPPRYLLPRPNPDAQRPARVQRSCVPTRAPSRPRRQPAVPHGRGSGYSPGNYGRMGEGVPCAATSVLVHAGLARPRCWPWALASGPGPRAGDVHRIAIMGAGYGLGSVAVEPVAHMLCRKRGPDQVGDQPATEVTVMIETCSHR